MKLTPVLLGISVAANAALLVLWLRPGQESAEAAAAEQARAAQAEHAGGAASDAAAIAERKASEKAGPGWTALSSASLPDMVARLRAAGYPVSAIRALVAARLSEQMAGRRRELMAGVEESPYWQTSFYMMNPKVAAAQRELYQEQQKIMKELLGPDAIDDNEIAQFYRRGRYGDVAPEKAEELQRISVDYNELRNEIYAKTNGMLMPEDQEKIAFLDKELRSDFAKVLTPEELQNYELRSSSTASTLRSQLTTFQPTEAEFRALFSAARAVEEQYGPLQGPTSQAQMQQRQKAMSEQAKLALTPERYAEFAQATDPKNMMLNRVVARYQLPPTVVPQVAAVQEDIQRRAATLRTLKGAEQASAAAALATEAAAKIKPLLGEQAFSAYKVYGGQWIERIATPPPSPPPAASAPTR